MEKRKILTLFLVVITFSLIAQCPVITCPSTETLGCSAPVTVSATSNYSANVISKWIAPGNFQILSSGNATSVVSFGHAGTYTVLFTDTVSNCSVSDTIKINLGSSVQTAICSLNLSAMGFGCPNSTIQANISNAQTLPIAGGAISYTMGVSGAAVPAIGVLSTSSVYSITTCGHYFFMVRDNSTNCSSSFTVPFSCSSLTVPVVSVTGPQTVCLGSSANLISGGAATYSWTSGQTVPSINVLPVINTTYAVTGQSTNGCSDTKTTVVVVDQNCADIWPGDANSDGGVDQTDIFELGLAFNATGPARSSASNLWASHTASVWSGTVSTGKNRCHADCNGDGSINFADTVAIYNNFSQTHSFKPSASSGINSELHLYSSQPKLSGGSWNKIDILLGDSLNNVSDIYGVAFDLAFDASLIENNAFYLNYPASFLDQGQNIVFRKKDSGNGVIYAATVRTNKAGVNGAGKIAEFHFKLKDDLTDGTIGDFTLANCSKVNVSGAMAALSSGSLSLEIDNSTVGIKAQARDFSFLLFPNPAADEVNFFSPNNKLVEFQIHDLSGRALKQGTFTGETSIPIRDISPGMYMVHCRSGSDSTTVRLIILR